MIRRTLLGFYLAILSLTSMTAFAVDTPSMHQIYDAARAGRLNEARGMIQQVLKEHPDSPKAHYVDAELLAKAGRSAEAREELNKAEQLAPGLPFIAPQSVQELKASIDSTLTRRLPMMATPTTRGGFPWGWVFVGVGLLALIAFIRRLMARPNAVPTAYPVNYQGGFAPGGYVHGAQATPGLGSNILSGLATGAALGAGMVAGEELVRHFTDGNATPVTANQSVTDSWETDPDKLGGTDFGIADNSSRDDSSNMAEMPGGDDWS